MRVYMCGIGMPKTDDANEVLLNIILETERAKEVLDENAYGNWVVVLHNHMREMMGLPNNVFTIRKYEDETKAVFIFFDKKPDGKHYDVFVEEKEEEFTLYIEVGE